MNSNVLLPSKLCVILLSPYSNLAIKFSQTSNSGLFQTDRPYISLMGVRVLHLDCIVPKLIHVLN